MGETSLRLCCYRLANRAGALASNAGLNPVDIFSLFFHPRSLIGQAPVLHAGLCEFKSHLGYSKSSGVVA